jgi:L-ribulose-5-phosphate 3-epimerase UlaE
VLDREVKPLAEVEQVLVNGGIRSSTLTVTAHCTSPSGSVQASTVNRGNTLHLALYFTK